MCSFAKSFTPLYFAPKPLSTDPTAHQNKAAYQTPKYFELPKKNDEKKCQTKKKIF